MLEQPLGEIGGIVRPKRPARLPTVLSRAEVDAVLEQLHGTEHLLASLLYGAGLRLLEALRLRAKDLDFERRQLVVRDGKGRKDRVTMLPDRVHAPLRTHLRDVRRLHERDLEAGYGAV